MTPSSRADSCLLRKRSQLVPAAFALSLALFGFTAQAFAQDEDSGPLQLFPSQPAPSGTPENPANLPAGAQEQFVTPSDVVISVERLGSIDPDTIGLLDGSNGGLGVDMWQGSQRADIHDLLAGLPTQLPSPALRGLARRLLLSTAELPLATDAGNEAATPEKARLIRTRAEKLIAMGFLEDAISLIDAAEGSIEREPAIDKLMIQARLLLGDFGGACNLIRTQESNLSEAYWQKRLVLCQLLDGNTTAAQFGATLLQDNGEQDPLFFALVARISEQRAVALPEFDRVNDLHLALLWLAKLPLPDTLLASADPATMRAIAENPHSDLNVRLLAAEQAARVGAIPADMLAEIYKSVEFSAEELRSPISIAEATYDARGRALLYQAASIESVPETKALVIQKDLELARRNGLYPLSVDVHATQITQLPVTGDLWEFSGEAARALYAIGRPKPADAWVSHLANQAQRDPAAQSLKDGLWAFSRLASDSYDSEMDEIQRSSWAKQTRARVPDQSPFEAMRRLELAYSLMDALGRVAVPPAAWRELLDLPRNRYVTLPNPGLVQLTTQAAQEGRRAETVAWTLWTLGEGGPAQADAETLKSVIAALGKVGLARAGYDLAMEAALQNDL
ncbi:hypothetical protein [Aestuariispira insulae]|uniref:Tetratricopeptide repeat protein n=1 Tax=Aestuariispira insulae TaxID=1461337 RepID=A0A3D9HPA5_9PROT|nr:hypothetical protein [Aestuariispira insulae]RED51245.1 hypothetical protein DFP90_10343 [Aestuariispira insulae]